MKEEVIINVCMLQCDGGRVKVQRRTVFDDGPIICACMPSHALSYSVYTTVVVYIVIHCRTGACLIYAHVQE